MTDPFDTPDFHGEQPPPPGRAYQFMEVLAFIALVVLSMVLSSLWVGPLQFTSIATAIIIRDLALVVVILLLLRRHREPVAQLGWNFRNGFKDVILGLLLFVPFTFGADLLDGWLRTVGFSAPGKPLPAFLAAKGPGEIVLAFCLVAVVALAEETIFRGYLMLRFRAVTRSAGVAVVLSAVLFALGHGYEGSAGVVTVEVMGLVFALVYLWRGSLAAPIIMHFLQDFIGIVLPPLLGGG